MTRMNNQTSELGIAWNKHPYTSGLKFRLQIVK
eukprot:UN18704